MNKISKKLKNVIILNDNSQKIQNFIEEIRKKGLKIYSVKCPKELNDITTSFVDKNWKISDWRLEDKIIFGKVKSNQAVIVFGDDSLQHLLIGLIDKYNLSAIYKYLVEYKDSSQIITERFVSGVSFAEEEATSNFKSSKYTVAKCFV